MRYNEASMHLKTLLNKYEPRDLLQYQYALNVLKRDIYIWSDQQANIFESGSRAKGTAISLGSDVDYLVSLPNNFKKDIFGLEDIYESLYKSLKAKWNVRKQNVSVHITLMPANQLAINCLEVDITPARKLSGITNDHSVYVSKLNTWKQTNIKRHIDFVSQSGRTDEIKLLKIWRNQNNLDFPSIYLEILLINVILSGRSRESYELASNFWYVLQRLAADQENPLFTVLIDPANSNNDLSSLLTNNEKGRIISAAKQSAMQQDWQYIIW